MLQDPTLPLMLNAMEVIHLTDSIKNGDVAEGLPEKDAYVPLARGLLLLFGSAYRELVRAGAPPEPGPVFLEVTQEQAWLLRTKVRTSDLGYDGVTNIGAGLLIKLYALLLEFNADVPELFAAAGKTLEDQDFSPETRAKLETYLYRSYTEGI